MKAHILHPKSVKQPSPPNRSLSPGYIASLLGPRLLNGLEQAKDGLRDGDGEGLLHPAFRAREKDGPVFEVNAVAGNGALAKAGSGSQPDFK